jgi:hypothetical protein
MENIISNPIRRNRQTDKSIVTFPVHTEPLEFVSKEAIDKYEGSCGIAIVRDDTNKIVTPGLSLDYNLVTHTDVIDAVEMAFGINNLKFEVYDIYTGGTRGNKMFIQYILPDYQITINSELYMPFVQIQNSYDKSSLFRSITGVYRQTCSNGAYILRSSKSLIKAKHYGNKIDLTQVTLNLNDWLETLNITKFKLETLVQEPVIFNEWAIEDHAKKIFTRKKDVKAFIDSLLIEKYVEELGENKYALFNAYTDYATHYLGNRMKNFDHILKSFAAIEKYFLN